MSTSVDGAAPSVSPDPDDGDPRPTTSPAPGSPAVDSGSNWVRAEMARRMAANRSTRGRHARRGVAPSTERHAGAVPPAPGAPADGPRLRDQPAPGVPASWPTAYASPAELPENYVPRHSVQTPGPAAEPSGPISGPINRVVGGPSLPPTGMPLPLRKRRGSGPGRPLQADGPAVEGPWSRPGGSVVPNEPVRRLGDPPEALDASERPPSWGVPVASPPRGFGPPVPPKAPADATAAPTETAGSAEAPGVAGVAPGVTAGPRAEVVPGNVADRSGAAEAGPTGAAGAAAGPAEAARPAPGLEPTTAAGRGAPMRPAEAAGPPPGAAPTAVAGRGAPLRPAEAAGPAPGLEPTAAAGRGASLRQPAEAAGPPPGAAPTAVAGRAADAGAAAVEPTEDAGPANTAGSAPTESAAAPLTEAGAPRRAPAPAPTATEPASAEAPAAARPSAPVGAAPDATDTETTDEILDPPTTPHPVVLARRSVKPGRPVGVPAQRTAERRRVAPRPATPRNIPVVGTAPPEPGSTRVRVVLSERKGVARAVRTIKEVQEGTAVGELLRRDLIRSQLLVTLRFTALTVLVLGALPAVFALLPAAGWIDVLGVRLPWLLLGVLAYPFLVGVAWRYTRVADRVEQNFADHVQD